MIRIIILMVINSTILAATIDITMKGRWVTECNSVKVSEHNRYDKALQAAINQNADCNVFPPDRFEVRRKDQIILSWNLPARREDGTELKTIDRFNIYQTFNDGSPVVIEAQATSTSITLVNIEKGAYSFQISTVSEGVEGKKSDAIQVDLN